MTSIALTTHDVDKLDDDELIAYFGNERAIFRKEIASRLAYLPLKEARTVLSAAYQADPSAFTVKTVGLSFVAGLHFQEGARSWSELYSHARQALQTVMNGVALVTGTRGTPAALSAAHRAAVPRGDNTCTPSFIVHCETLFAPNSTPGGAKRVVGMRLLITFYAETEALAAAYVARREKRARGLGRKRPRADSRRNGAGTSTRRRLVL